MSSTQSLNHLMHPRNPYKNTPPDFQALAIAYPDLRKHCTYDNGKVMVNFKSDDAVRELTKAILHKDFGLTVELPKGSLVPRVPQKINYLLWIEDILELNNLKDGVYGIDIGTGASCIYSLLGASLKKWKFIASDVDQSSLKVAEANIKNNNLEEFIALFHVRNNDIIKELVALHYTIKFTFCMCNPPFFEEDEANHRFLYSSKDGGFVNSSYLETDQQNNLKRGPPGRPCSFTVAKANELIVEGGEVAFVNRIIDDSIQLETSIKVYTTMLGKKSSLLKVIQRLSQLRNICFNYSTLNQGKTKRWVIVWTFCLDLYIHGDLASDNDLILNLSEKLDTTNENWFEWLIHQFTKYEVDVFHKGDHFLRCETLLCTWEKYFFKKENSKKSKRKSFTTYEALEFEEAQLPTKMPRRTAAVFSDTNLISMKGDSLNCVDFQGKECGKKIKIETGSPYSSKSFVRFSVFHSPICKTKFFFAFEDGAKVQIDHLIVFLNNKAQEQFPLSKN